MELQARLSDENHEHGCGKVWYRRLIMQYWVAVFKF